MQALAQKSGGAATMTSSSLAIIGLIYVFDTIKKPNCDEDYHAHG
jgi:hypothetical protein